MDLILQFVDYLGERSQFEWRANWQIALGILTSIGVGLAAYEWTTNRERFLRKSRNRLIEGDIQARMIANEQGAKVFYCATISDLGESYRVVVSRGEPPNDEIIAQFSALTLEEIDSRMRAETKFVLTDFR